MTTGQVPSEVPMKAVKGSVSGSNDNTVRIRDVVVVPE